MAIELQCPHCHCCFAPLEEDATDTMLEQVGLWDALGEGETIEDKLFAQLTDEGNMHCPECDAAVRVNEERLGQLAMQLLLCW